jgi:HSP20 family protein
MALIRKKAKKKATSKARTPKKTGARKKAAAGRKAAAEKKAEDESSVAVQAAPEESPIEARLHERLAEVERMLEGFRGRDWLRPFDIEWPRWPELQLEGRFPSVDVIDKEKEIEVKAEAPGFEKDDLSVTVADRTLTIKGESRHEEESGEGEHHRREIRSGSFSRTMTLPADVDGKKAKASYKDGVLQLTLPKARRAKKHDVQVD